MTAMSTARPNVADDSDKILERVRALQPLLRANAAGGEQDRRVHEESLKALRDAGALRLGQPRRFGGSEVSLSAMLDVSAAIAEGDGGTSWVATLANVCAWTVGLFPERAQEEVWGDDPDALISGVLAPTATTRRVDGGFRVTGKWYYNSGSWHAGWATLGIPVTDDEGEIVDQAAALIPRSDLSFEDTWFVAGMRSSGSNCLIAEDVFVPDHRIMPVPPAVEGTYLTEHHDEALYRSAFIPVLALVLAGPQLGLGRAALELVRTKAAVKPISYTFYEKQADSVGFQLQLAEAAMLVDSAHLHAYRAAADIDSAAQAGGYPDFLTRARVRADTAWAVQSVTKAIDLLLWAHGAASFAETNALQRIWRDSSVAARHAMVLPTVSYETYGKALLDRDDHITPML